MRQEDKSHLSAKVDGKLVFDFGALLVGQHEGPQHKAPYIDHIEQGFIHRMLLQEQRTTAGEKLLFASLLGFKDQGGHAKVTS